jgi:RimJ/RimL family protein N-acetyltransferase
MMPPTTCIIAFGSSLAKPTASLWVPAILRMSRMALTQNDTHYVITETEKDNPKSENILKRIGFYQEYLAVRAINQAFYKS